MLKKKLLILSSGMLLAATLAGCNPAQASGLIPGTTENSDESSATSVAPAVAGKVVVAEDEETAETFDLKVLPKDISLGTTVNLEEHVQVTKVDTWTIETASETVEISGHTFKAIGYGAYTVTIVAGTTRRAINGNVVTASKVQFNELFSSIKDDYSVSSSLTGGIGLHKSYWYEVEGDADDEGVYTFFGGITHPTSGTTYAFNVTATENADEELEFADEIEIQPGFGRSVADRGFGADFGEIKASDFVQQFDKDGDPTGYFIVEDGNTDDDDTSPVSRFVDSLFGKEVWSDIRYYVLGSGSKAKLNLAGSVDKKTGGLSFFPATEKGQIKDKMTISGKSYSTKLSVADIGNAALDGCEAWLENPVAPDPIDITAVKDFFAQVEETKSYTQNSFGSWWDLTNEKEVECPSGMRFSDTKTELFPNFDIQTNVNANVIENVYGHVDELATLPDDEMSIPSEGSSDLFFVYDNHSYTASKPGLQDPWGAAVAEEDPFSDSDEDPTVWDSIRVPYVFMGQDSHNILDLASWCSYEELDNGDKVFGYNTNGTDMKYGANKFYAGLPFFAAQIIPSYLGYVPVFYASYLDWWTYFEFSLTVSESSAAFVFEFDYNDTTHYFMGWTITLAENDPVSEGAMAVYNSVVNPSAPTSEDTSAEVPTSEEISGEPATSEEAPVSENISLDGSSEEEEESVPGSAE